VPSHHSQAQLVEATVAFYETFKANFIEPACEAGHYRVRSAGDTKAHTVSEAHGYGMLFAVLMADHDAEARTIFDGMVAYALAHPSWSEVPGLMAWAQDAECNDVQGGNAATDGDLDIAYALWLADARWGSDGTVNYRERALAVLSGILAGEIADENHIMIGDWVGDDHWRGTRPSDWMTSHLKSFAKMSGEKRWDAVVDRTYEIGKLVQGNDSQVGLLPDFVDGAESADPWPAHEGWLEGPNDGNYGYNACRVPWRLATDYLLFGDERARAIVRKLNAFVRGATGDDPSGIVDGYTLGGSPYGSYPSPAFVAPFMVSAMVEPEEGSNGPWLDALWDQVTGMEPGSYYGDSIKLATMMVVSGMWKKP
jgi:endoglucanase